MHMTVDKEVAKRYAGQWVHCHSVYGLHEGVVFKIFHDGIILIHHTQLASGSEQLKDTVVAEADPGNGLDDTRLAQFFLPAPGLFVPFGGMYGLWPRPGFFI